MPVLYAGLVALTLFEMGCGANPRGALGGQGGEGGGSRDGSFPSDQQQDSLDGSANDAAGASDATIAGDVGRADVASGDSRADDTCLTSVECSSGRVCTTEDGVCIPRSRPCLPGAACPAVCSGTCRPANAGPVCGNTSCEAGLRCCNQSCGTCVAPGGSCTEQACLSQLCLRDSDCRLVDDYCTGCNCRVLSNQSTLPACPGPGVRCLVAPCMGKVARCVSGECAFATGS